MNVFLGVCEDNSSDPLKIGRVKIRVFGIHTEIRKGEEDGKGIATKDLPWATPCYPINTQTIDGMSDFSVPANGSVVMVVFLDNDNQHPVYFGTLPKIADVIPDFNMGFSDPNKQHPSKDYQKESPISRLARNENIDKTIVQTKAKNLKTGIETNTTSFDEPMTEYDAVYPHNRVIESASGHIIEIDDTAGAERINIHHSSGTFIEMYPDGSSVSKIQKTNTTIIIKDNNILVEGDQNVRIKGSENVQIDGAQSVKVGGDVTLDCGGTVKVTASSNVLLDGGSGSLAGVVTGNHICHATGKPHGSISGTVKASI